MCEGRVGKDRINGEDWGGVDQQKKNGFFCLILFETP